MRKLCKCGIVNYAEKKKMVVHPYIQLEKRITKTCLKANKKFQRYETRILINCSVKIII